MSFIRDTLIPLAKGPVKRLRAVGLPLPWPLKQLVAGLYWATKLFRATLRFLYQLLIVEPVFRAIAKSVGRNLTIEEIPWITGMGEIVIGDHVRMSGKQCYGFNTNMQTPPVVDIGDYTYLGHEVRFSASSRIAVGRHCYIAGQTSIYDSDGHPIDADERRERLPVHSEDVRPVTIGDDVWIGNRVFILKGVTIGDRAIVGACSVVTRDVPADCIAAGNPARVVKRLRPTEEQDDDTNEDTAEESHGERPCRHDR